MPYPFQTKSAKVLWVLAVCLGFIGAGILIGKSYKEWQEHPIATSITTHPIENLDFPNVTICPPKDSNTALYHDLVKAGNGSLSDSKRKTLKEAANEIFMGKAHKEYVKKMSATLHMGNMDQVLQGFHSLPTPCNDANGLKIKMWNLNGTITTPWFQKEYVEEFYQWDRDFLMVLELPDDIKDQVGRGSLIINLEVDTREEQDWVEEVSLMPNFTFHTTRKTWSEAEADCQRDGGNLASVTSEEVNQAVMNVAGDNQVWLGGRRELREWTWSDLSTWGYSSWDSFSIGGDCARFESGKWYDPPCSKEYQFICQKKNNLKGQRKINLVYTIDKLEFSSFNVRYKYEAASQLLLDGWKNKRMTGFRLSWRIENKNPPLTAKISVVGRSVETPNFGDTFEEISEPSLDSLYKVTLAPPKDLQMINDSLVIELNVNKKQSDEVHAFTSYMLYKEKKSWTDADIHCKNKGGQLASIHSKREQMMAEKAAEGEFVWLGGRKIDGKWHWANNATWNFENWMRGYPGNDAEYLQLFRGGQWIDYWSTLKSYFLCQGPTAVLPKSGLARIEFSKEQLAYFPFHMFFKSRSNDQLPLLNTTSKKERRNSGFSLNWFIRSSNGTQVTKKLPARPEDWKNTPTPLYKQTLLHNTIRNARELRLQNRTKEMLPEVIYQKLQTSVVAEPGYMCLRGQVRTEKQKQVFSNILSNVTKNNTLGETSDKDIEAGYEIFHAVVFCPEIVFNLYTFVDHLLSNETTRTIIQTSVHVLQSAAISDKGAFTLARQFYNVLADTLDMQYGGILLATTQMQAVIRNNWPFLTNYTDLVQKCLQESNCDTLQTIYHNIGNVNDFFSFVLFYCRCSEHLTRAVPPSSPPDS